MRVLRTSADPSSRCIKESELNTEWRTWLLGNRNKRIRKLSLTAGRGWRVVLQSHTDKIVWEVGGP